MMTGKSCFRLLLVAILLPLSLVSCLSKDEATSVYIEPSGSVDLIVYRDNMRSTSDDPKERAKEHSKWIRETQRLESSEYKSMRDAGAVKIREEVLRDQPPFASVLSARFPDVASYAKYLGVGSDDKEARMTFSKDGKKRKLVIAVSPKSKEAMEQKRAEAKKAPKKTKESHDIVFKIVTVGGTITGSKGFRISETKDSALLDVAEFERLEDEGTGYEFHLDWKI